MSDIDSLVEILDVCRPGGRRLYIQTHNFPDPDAIASAFGLQRLLERRGIPSTLCSVGMVDRVSSSRMLTSFGIELHQYDELKDEMSEEDWIICVDSQKNAGNITDITGDEIACIDHHPTVVDVQYLYKDVRLVGACSSMIAGYFKDAGVEPGIEAATALLYGIKMDTQQFQRGVTQFDIDMFGYLLERCDPAALKRLEINNIVMDDLKAYAAAINNIRLFGVTGFAEIPFSCPDGLIASVSDFILALDEVDVAVVWSHRDNGLKFSVRSLRDDADAGQITRRALSGIGSGGGHATMAGGFVPSANVPHHLGTDVDNMIEERFMRVIGELLG